MKRIDSKWRLPYLEPVPDSQQFFSMLFCPCLYLPLLASWKYARDPFNLINRIYSDLSLIISVKMGSVMLRSRFCKHADDNPEKSSNFRHLCFLVVANY